MAYWMIFPLVQDLAVAGRVSGERSVGEVSFRTTQHGRAIMRELREKLREQNEEIFHFKQEKHQMKSREKQTV